MELFNKEDVEQAIINTTAYDSIERIYDESQKDWFSMHGWIGGINDALEAIRSVDSIEVVNCKDCSHYCCIIYGNTGLERGICCGWHDEITFVVGPHDFCFRGER